MASQGQQNKTGVYKGGTWRLRVCPVQFGDFCRMKKEFQMLVKASLGLEYRMSQHLGVKMSETGDWVDVVGFIFDKAMPWLPNEKVYTKPQNAATAGMLEMKVNTNRLVDVMTALRSGALNKTARLRFELKRFDPNKMNSEGTTGEAKSQKKTTAEGGDDMDIENEEMEKRKWNDDKFDMTVNFAVRLSPVKPPAFTHPKDHKLTSNDKHLFVKKVPLNVPDDVLKMIVMLKLLHRTPCEDGTQTAVFEENSEHSAQTYMELFEGILLNGKELELSTSLSTLYDAKKKHADLEARNRQVNVEQVQGLKRKLEEGGDGAPEFKKPRPPQTPREDLTPTSLLWMHSHTVRGRGAPRGRGPAQPGFRGRGAPPGRGMPMNRGRGGASPRGFPPNRGGVMRGGSPMSRGRGGARPPVARGRSGMPMRGGRGGERGRGGMPPPRGGPRGGPRGRGGGDGVQQRFESRGSAYRDIRLYE